MIKVIKTNKTLFIVLAGVLVIGACLAVVLSITANAAKAEQQIQTAAEEAVVDNSLTEEAQNEAAEPAETPDPISAEGLRRIVMNKEYRRSYLIPIMDNNVIREADTWSSIEPDNYYELRMAAFYEAKQYAEDFFGLELNDASGNFWYYTDTSELRSDFIKFATMDDSIVCTLKADTLELINIDYNYVPSQKVADEDSLDNTSVSDKASATANKIADVLGSQIMHIQYSGGGGYQQEYAVSTFNIITKDKYISFGLLNGECYSVSVYPTPACMNESVYFEADIQRDPSVVQLATPQDFEEGEPGSDDMTEDEALEMYMSFLTLANGDGDYDDPSMTFYIDNSGVRENYWHMQSEKLTMDVASNSKWIVNLTCDYLWNPDYDLTKIRYNGMGGAKYEEYIENIMGSIFGDDMLKVEPNAVYDSHYCTEIVVMADNTGYEFMFEDGKLILVKYAFDLEYFCEASGWEADNVYVNSTTGEEFITQY